MKVELIKPKRTVAELVQEELGFEIIYYEEAKEHRVVNKRDDGGTDNRKATPTELALWRSLLEARKNADMPLKGAIGFKATAWVTLYVVDNELHVDEELYETAQDANESGDVDRLPAVMVDFFGVARV
jgi:hypothetical protein